MRDRRFVIIAALIAAVIGGVFGGKYFLHKDANVSSEIEAYVSIEEETKEEESAVVDAAPLESTEVSSEIEEMLSVCTRLIVMRDRKIVGELKDDMLRQDVIMQTIAGGKERNGQ